MKPGRFGSYGLLLVGLVTGVRLLGAEIATGFVSRADSPPRKMVVASAVMRFEGSLDQRLQLATRWLDAAAREASGRFGGAGLDLVVFPEFALQSGREPTAADQAVSLEGRVGDTIGAKARALHTWIVLPMTLRESPEGSAAAVRYSNAAVLFDREGRVAGIFRKVHPIADDRGVFEGGVTPGDDYPVFPCDFGKLGILICWDMSYEEAWDALAARGAEIVAVPTASPQNVQPAAQARRHTYYVVNSAPRDNATLFDPIGRVAAQQTAAPGMLIEQIDLAYAVLHWSETLRNGQAFADRYGARAGFRYSEREDTGVFWSNDSQLTVGAMVRELGLREMREQIAAMEAARLRAKQK